jgi:hypothetical protein
MISFESKFREKFSGIDFIITGGNSSFGPPEAVPLLAQCEKIKLTTTKNPKLANFLTINIAFYAK